MPDKLALAVVIPVFNEEQHVAGLLEDWVPIFRATGSPFRVILIDDGSTDGSLKVLQNLQQQEAALSIHTQPNAGHGAAILRGYKMALDADWVFQIDSDHQLDMAAFRELWENKAQYDLLLAERQERKASLSRRCITAVSRGIVYMLYGTAIRDVNAPYRLMRSEKLREALEKIPVDSFAPNILLVAWFVRRKSRIFTTGTMLRTGIRARASKTNGYFLRGALQSAFQTLLFRLK